MIDKIKFYEMGFLEEIHCDNFKVIRVPGGWIFTGRTQSNVISSVFVPYDNEFDNREPKKIEEPPSIRSQMRPVG